MIPSWPAMPSIANWPTVQPRDVAAWLGPQKLARAILYATVTNCVAFLPLLLVRGKMGEFIYSLPVVVTAALVSSRIVSMTFMPLLGYYVLRGQKGIESGAGGKRLERAAVASDLSRIRWLVPRAQGDHADRLRAWLCAAAHPCCPCWARPSSPRTCTGCSA